MRPRQRDGRSGKRKIQNQFKLVFVTQNDQKKFVGSCFILSVCFVLFLGLLGFELGTSTANTRSTLRGLNGESDSIEYQAEGGEFIYLTVGKELS